MPRQFKFSTVLRLRFPSVRGKFSWAIETCNSLPLASGDSPGFGVVEPAPLPRARGDMSLPALVDEAPKNEPA